MINEGTFKLDCYCEKCRGSDISCALVILVKNLRTDCWIVTVSYLKKQPTELFCKKFALKNFANFTGRHLCWSLFFIKLQAWGPAIFFKKTPGVFPLKFPKLFQKKFLWTSASVSSQVVLFRMREKDTANKT